MTEQRRTGEESIANLAAEKAEHPVPRRACVGLSAEQIKRELRQQQEDRYQAMLDRLYLHILRDEIPQEVFEEYRGRLRALAHKELGSERAVTLFDRERPSANFLRAVIARIEEQLGQKITELDPLDRFQVRDGRVYGRMLFDKQVWLPVVANEPVRRVASEDGETTYVIDWINQAFFVNGELAATGHVRREGVEDEEAERRSLPIWQGKVVEKMEGNEIYEGCVTGATEAGWSGWVKYDRIGLKIPVHNGWPRAAYRGRGIVDVDQIHDHEGKMSGLVATGHNEESGNTALKVMIDGQLVETLANYDEYDAVDNFGWITFQDLGDKEVWSGTAVGKTAVQFGFREEHVAVIAGEIVEEIEGVNISGARNIIFDDEGRPSGLVECYVEGHTGWLPLVKGQILVEIDGQTIMDAVFEELQDGQWTGYVRLDGGGVFPVWRGRLVRTWSGQPIAATFGNTHLFEIDGTVNGRISVRKDEDLVEQHFVLAALPPELQDQAGGRR